jgi:heat-inducible transcriptional repressor
MSITERQKSILWSIIEEHTKAAEPVSSKSLAEKRGFDIGAPMIRKEMCQLEQEGYLVQPHTSAGRIPTDKAYRLYIQEQMNKTSTAYKTNNQIGLSPKEAQKIKGSLNKKWADSQSLLKEVSKIASDISKELSVSGKLGGENSFMCGFSNLFDEPELRSFDNMNQIMRFMDNIDSYFDSLWNKILYEDMQVFIGRENPIKEINEFTLITGKYQLPEGEQGFVSIIGPKRMNYKRNMALVDYISKVINDK